jgi:hypothetical protein
MATQSLDRSAARQAGPDPELAPHCFLVGFPRSGLGLLQRILDAHPDLAVVPEVDWITDHYETRTGLSREGPLAPAQVFKWAEQGRFDPFGVGREQIKQLVRPGELLPWPGFLARLFGLSAKAAGKSLVGCKTPKYGRFLPALHSAWPGARFVHLIRDGRDVCLSLLDRHGAARATALLPAWVEDPLATAALFPTWAEDPVSTIAFWWKRRTWQGREAGAALGAGCYHELRYEALVGRPAAACAGLCAFLGLPYDEAMLRFHEGRACAGADAKSAWLPITPGLRDWRTQLPAEAQARFAAATGDLLDDLGYPRPPEAPGPETGESVALPREAFERACRSLGDWLP